MSVGKTLRYLVSRDKHRLQLEGYDFDLTYITSRIVAMGLPGETIDKAWRNDADAVADFFNQYHPGHYLIYNLAGVSYDYSKFNGKVLECGWPDHRPPGLEFMNALVLSIHNYLQLDQKNIVAIHCLAGRGRTGTVIVAYLLYCQLYKTPIEALCFFAKMRSSTGEGVTGPSQIRYINYYHQFINNQVPDHFLSLRQPPVVQLYSLSIDPPPLSDLNLTVEVYPMDRQDLCVWKKKYKDVTLGLRGDFSVTLQNCVVQGDVEIRFSHTCKNKLEWTSILRHYTKLELIQLAKDCLLRFSKSELDAATSGPCKNPLFHQKMKVEFEYFFSDTANGLMPQSTRFSHRPVPIPEHVIQQQQQQQQQQLKYSDFQDEQKMGVPKAVPILNVRSSTFSSPRTTTDDLSQGSPPKLSPRISPGPPSRKGSVPVVPSRSPSISPPPQNRNGPPPNKPLPSPPNTVSPRRNTVSPRPKPSPPLPPKGKPRPPQPPLSDSAPSSGPPPPPRSAKPNYVPPSSVTKGPPPRHSRAAPPPPTITPQIFTNKPPFPPPLPPAEQPKKKVYGELDSSLRPILAHNPTMDKLPYLDGFKTYIPPELPAANLNVPTQPLDTIQLQGSLIDTD